MLMTQQVGAGDTCLLSDSSGGQPNLGDSQAPASDLMGYWMGPWGRSAGSPHS